MRTWFLLITLGVLTLDGAAQTPTWKAELIATPPGSWSLAAPVAVNDAGRIVGNCSVSSTRRAWVAGPGLPIQLLPLPMQGTYAQVYDINAAGVAAGYVLIAGRARAVIWKPSPTGYKALVVPRGSANEDPFDARAINDAGDVVGKLGLFSGSYHWNESTGLTSLGRAVFPEIPDDVNERGQIVGGSYRLDLATRALTSIGNPTGTTYNYVYTELTCINDAGQCGGYAVVATSLPPYLAVRYTDGPTWKLFNSFPMRSASVQGLAASGDTLFQLGANFGMWVYVEGHGSLSLQRTLAPAYANWDLTNSWSLKSSRNGRIACTGADPQNRSGIVLLTPLAFEDLGGATRGALGTPALSGYGTLVGNAPTRVRLASAAPNRTALFAWSATSAPAPLFGGTLHVNPPSAIVPLQTDALGRLDLTFNWPAVARGTRFYLQAGVVDPSATGNVALSNALRGVTR